jgi:hypothetical protein
VPIEARDGTEETLARRGFFFQTAHREHLYARAPAANTAQRRVL